MIRHLFRIYRSLLSYRLYYVHFKYSFYMREYIYRDIHNLTSWEFRLCRYLFTVTYIHCMFE